MVHTVQFLVHHQKGSDTVQQTLYSARDGVPAGDGTGRAAQRRVRQERTHAHGATVIVPAADSYLSVVHVTQPREPCTSTGGRQREPVACAVRVAPRRDTAHRHRGAKQRSFCRTRTTERRAGGGRGGVRRRRGRATCAREAPTRRGAGTGPLQAPSRTAAPHGTRDPRVGGEGLHGASAGAPHPHQQPRHGALRRPGAVRRLRGAAAQDQPLPPRTSAGPVLHRRDADLCQHRPRGGHHHRLPAGGALFLSRRPVPTDDDDWPGTGVCACVCVCVYAYVRMRVCMCVC